MAQWSRWSHVGFQESARRRHPGRIMITYRLKDNVVTHFPAIFKGLGSKPSVIHMALDVELHGGVLAVRVAGGRPIECGKCSRGTVVDLARELIGRKHRVVLVEEACGFGYAFHRQLRQIGVEAFVVATEMLNRKRKTNRRDAGKLLDQLYDFDVNGHKKALRAIRVPTLQEQKSRRLCRMRSQLIKLRNIMEGQGRGVLFDFDFHEVPQGWWGPRKWPKLRAKLLAHDPWLIEMLEHHQRLLIAQQRRIAQLDREIAQESDYDGRKVAKGLGQTTFASLQREAMDWKRFANRKQIGSYIGCCPSEFSTGTRQKLGSIDRLGNRRMRTVLVEAVWRLKKWNPSWRGFRKFPHVFGHQATARGATRKKAVVACARLLAVDLWRLQTGRATLNDLGLKPAQAQ
jgi:transposase